MLDIETINQIRRLRMDGMTIGDIADRIDWPKHKSLRQIEQVCRGIRPTVGGIESPKSRPNGGGFRIRNVEIA